MSAMTESAGISRTTSNLMAVFEVATEPRPGSDEWPLPEFCFDLAQVASETVFVDPRSCLVRRPDVHLPLPRYMTFTRP